MEDVQTHFQTYYGYYIVAVLVLFPLFLIWRRYTVPVTGYLLKSAICAAGAHSMMHLLVIFAAWFKGESTLKYGNVDADYSPGWTTPLLEFWDRQLYTPTGIFYLEMAIGALVFYLVWRNQPVMFPQGTKAVVSRKAATAQAEAARRREMARKQEITRKLAQSRRAKLLGKDTGDPK